MITKNKDSQFKLYPVPFDGSKIYLESVSTLPQLLTLDVYSVDGKCVASELKIDNSAANSRVSIDFDNRLTPGVYILSVNGADISEKQMVVVE